MKTVILGIAISAMLLTPVLAAGGKKSIGAPTGGFLVKENKGSVVEVYNDQTLCPKAAITGTALMFNKLLFCKVNVIDGPAPQGAMPTNVAARIVVVAMDSVPALLAAPEEAWAQVNVKPLLADNPDETTLRQRTIKEMWRALGLSLGCAYSATQPCVMSEVRSLSDLDAIPRIMGPEAQSKVDVTARRRGVVPIQYVSYRQACEEGWAPAPTNDVQKAIWDKVHAMPTEPIKIKPEEKKTEK